MHARPEPGGASNRPAGVVEFKGVAEPLEAWRCG
jgi:hypothetical protein